jgi:hypothetical protein
MFLSLAFLFLAFVSTNFIRSGVLMIKDLYPWEISLAPFKGAS